MAESLKDGKYLNTTSQSHKHEKEHHLLSLILHMLDWQVLDDQRKWKYTFFNGTNGLKLSTNPLFATSISAKDRKSICECVCVCVCLHPFCESPPFCCWYLLVITIIISRLSKLCRTHVSPINNFTSFFFFRGRSILSKGCTWRHVREVPTGAALLTAPTSSASCFGQLQGGQATLKIPSAPWRR